MPPGISVDSAKQAMPRSNRPILTATKALFVGVLALGASQPAQAQLGLDECSWSVTVSNGVATPGGNCQGDTLTIGDKIVSNLSFDFENSTIPDGLYKGTFRIEWFGTANTDWSDDVFDVTTTFDPQLSAPVGTTFGPVLFDYLISIDQAIAPGYYFNTVGLEAVTGTDAPSRAVVVKGFRDDGLVNIENVNGQDFGPTPNPYSLQGLYTSLQVGDAFTLTTTVDGGGDPARLSGVVNEFTQKTAPVRVPGPLSILGAAAAFGYSRKLRSRIKTYSL